MICELQFFISEYETTFIILQLSKMICELQFFISEYETTFISSLVLQGWYGQRLWTDRSISWSDLKQWELLYPDQWHHPQKKTLSPTMLETVYIMQCRTSSLNMRTKTVYHIQNETAFTQLDITILVDIPVLEVSEMVRAVWALEVPGVRGVSVQPLSWKGLRNPCVQNMYLVVRGKVTLIRRAR